MIKWRVKELAQEQGYDTAYKLALAAGLPYNSVKAIWDSKAKRIDLDTLEKLGGALKADLGDLFIKDEESGNFSPELLAAA